jgi:predicted PolB exonuclease-like 3'-5' exonuclease
MTNPSVIVFDIETLPNDLDDTMYYLLEHKVRNVVEEKKEQEMLHYRFHEPPYARICAISVIWSKDGETVTQEKLFFNRNDEKQILEEFIKFIKNFTGRFVHFNGLDFDVPFILYKCCQYGIEPPQRFCNLIRFRSEPHFDLMQILTAWGKFRISLAEALVTFGIKNSKNVLQGKDTLLFLLSATNDEIKEYSMEDTKSTFELYKKVHLIYS